ncbi:class I SAM-dependent methyltransferase [Desertimonas flava]|uniref:class I SAM-dependent methyltransferase n=1 Tax=Desertimonas flava TaxID=2064846 RepID=UPI0013C52990|nr:class I SAM-dependent methyltransferase [Desertimonas flava]
MRGDDNRYWSAVDEQGDDAHGRALRFVEHNKFVLELGPAAGHVTRALVDRGCQVVGIEVDPAAAAALDDVAECVVGDLDDPATISKVAGERRFDVVLAGDVLEHLRDPLGTLRACREVLAPGGYIVVSVPNIAHADVTLSLLKGQFTYRNWGLLDATHIHFFTRTSLEKMIDDAGFVMVDLERVTYPVFATELALDRSEVSDEVVEAVLQNRDAETYQFVCRAVPHDGNVEVARLARRVLAAEERARRYHSDCLRAQAEIESIRHETSAEIESIRHESSEQLPALIGENAMLRQQLAAAEESVAAWSEQARRQEIHVAALLNSRTMRIVRPFRALYGVLRGSR